MSFDIINPRATATIAFEGLAVLCFNESQGRWEVAIPRFDDHNLSIAFGNEIPDPVKPEVKLIEIKPTGGVRPDKPRHEVEARFNRLDGPNNQNKNVFRWVRDFTDSKELPHRNVRPITSPDRVKVTMMYVHDAVFYTKNLDNSAVTIIRAGQANTVPVRGNTLARNVSNALSVLDKAHEIGTEANVLGMDIETAAGGAVEIFFDKVLQRRIDKGVSPQEVSIANIETPFEIPDDRKINSDMFEFGLGDFFRYYQLFEVDGTKSHLWGRVALGIGTNLDCCCNPVTVNLANLNAFSQS